MEAFLTKVSVDVGSLMIGNSWLHTSEFKRLKKTRFCFREVSSLLSNTFPFDFHSRLFCVGMLERKPQRWEIQAGSLGGRLRFVSQEANWNNSFMILASTLGWEQNTFWREHQWKCHLIVLNPLSRGAPQTVPKWGSLLHLKGLQQQ